MRNLLIVEFRKAFFNPWFLAALAIGVSLCIADAIDTISKTSYFDILEEARTGSYSYSELEFFGCFNHWMSVYGESSFSSVFYLIAPLLAVTPFSWSLASERRSSYVNQIYTRTGRRQYLFSKALVAFVSGGTVVVVPQLVNLALIATAFPAYVPQVFDAVGIGIYYDNLWARLFYEAPGLYVAAYCMLDFVLCGVWAAFVLLIGCVIANSIAVLVVPYVGIYVLQFLNERIFLALGGIRGIQLSIFENLHAYTTQYVQNGWIIAAEIALIAVASLALMRKGVKRDEL